MTNPYRFLLRMLLFLALVAGVAAVLFAGLQRAFLVNPGLNGLIAGVFLFGVFHNLRQVMRLRREVQWIAAFRDESPADADPPEPRLLAPMASMLGERRGRLSLSAPALRSLLDSIASRLDESRDLSRYMIGLMIFLGLLGTFWGLSQTIGSIGDVIRGMRVGGGDVAQVFESLKLGLGAPLAGMGTAFTSSLFGLSGSLVLGFLDLQQGQAQNRFFTELEDWLAASTRLSSGALAVDAGEASVPIYLQALLEQTADSLDGLHKVLQRGEEQRGATNAQLASLSERLTTLTEQMRADQRVMLQLAEGQADVRPLLERLAETARPGPAAGLDEATRGHIRNLDLYVARLIEEMIAGREEIIRQVRSDLKLLARTVAAVADEAPRHH